MPGYELINEDEKNSINQIFSESNGVLFAHGFDGLRNGRYRVREFEKQFSETISAQYSQAVSSGSQSILVALKALGIGVGDEVIVPSFTFIATVEAVILSGATPVIVDIDKSLGISEKALIKNINKNTKAVIPVHMMGEAADLRNVLKIARANDIYVIEDNAQCFGGYFGNKALGTLGDIGCFSFDHGKTITTGEGGMVVCSEFQTYKTARAIHDHGHEYSDPNRAEDPAIHLGFNSRMSELQAAVGLVQLQKLSQIISGQKKNKKDLKCKLASLKLDYRKTNFEEGDIGDSLIFYAPTTEKAQAIANELTKQKIGTKNLPSAIKWHFAAHWEHLASYVPNFYSNEGWQKSNDLLSRAIAIGISSIVNPTLNDRIAKIIINELSE